MCFTDAPRRWWHIFTRPGFRHAFALTYAASTDTWIMVEWHGRGIEVMPITVQQFEWVLANVQLIGGEAWRIKQRAKLKRHWLLPATCVSAIAKLVGLDGIYVTPYRLRCALSRHGGQQMV